MSAKRKIWLLIAPFALVCPGNAQEKVVVPPVPTVPEVSPNSAHEPLANEPEVTVEELIALALQNNPQLPIARENLEAARQRAGAARGFLNPTLEAVPRLLGSREAADPEIIVSQPLDVFGKRRAQSEVFAAQLRGAQAATTLAERSLIVQVKNAVSDLFAAQEAENLGVFQAGVAVLFRDAAARRAQLGDVPAVQVQRADLELLRVQNELLSARAERLARRAAVNQLTGQAPETPLRVALPLANDFATVLQLPTGATSAKGLKPLAPGEMGTGRETKVPSVGASSQTGADLVAQRAALLPSALERPDIVQAQATLEARQAQARAIGRQRYPDIELQVRHNSFFGDGSGSTALRAVVTVPLFDFGSIGREKKAAQADVRAGEAQLTLLRQQVATQVEQALIRLAQQRETVQNYRVGIVPLTLDLLRKTQVGYAQGASTYLEVLEAQRTLRTVQTEYLQALVGTRTSEAALESALGSAMPVDGGTGALVNPSGAASLPGIAEPGTVPENTIPSNPSEPLNPPSVSLPGTNAPEAR